jgi:hypothetical protein
MIKDPEAAKYVSEILLDIHDRLDESVAVIRDKWPQEDAAYRQAVATVLYELYSNLMNPLYLEHQNLKPSGWDGD